MTAVALTSEAESLTAELYGKLPARRAVILCHGQSWDASGWKDIAPRFAARGIPALALNFRGYASSTGSTTPASTVADLRAAKAWLRQNGVSELALVGASMGGHAVLGSSFERDIECVVSVSAPVQPVDDALSRNVTGRKLFICANEDNLGAAPHVLHTFELCERPKTLMLFGGTEHSIGMFFAPYGGEVIAAMLDFVAGRG
ncbi:MAG: alpha/beta fold hydrolase [Chloroflexota bacterium]|nr:alpha/beta fold hydrolase [Chloroflexota bacterium]